MVRVKARLQTVDAESANICLQCWNTREDKLIAFASTPVQSGSQDWHDVQSDSIEVPDDTEMLTVSSRVIRDGNRLV